MKFVNIRQIKIQCLRVNIKSALKEAIKEEISDSNNLKFLIEKTELILKPLYKFTSLQINVSINSLSEINTLFKIIYSMNIDSVSTLFICFFAFSIVLFILKIVITLVFDELKKRQKYMKCLICSLNIFISILLIIFLIFDYRPFKDFFRHDLVG